MNQTGVPAVGSRRQARRNVSFTRPIVIPGVLGWARLPMPYLRFSRDKRGYENTYVLHTFRGKRGPEPRLLYWFRTPPGARVGRHPLDAQAIRAIEASNPGLEFDWGEMLKVKPPPRPPENRRGKPRAAKKKPRDAPPSGRRAAPEEPAAPAAPDAAAPTAAEEEVAAAPDAEVADAADVEDAALSAAAAEDDDEAGRDEPWEHPVTALMGEEMLARLRARYSEIQVRIAERDAEPGVRDAALERARALNPDGWDTMEEAVRGIERFEAEAEAIRDVLDGPPEDHGDEDEEEDDPQPGEAPAADDDSQ